MLDSECSSCYCNYMMQPSKVYKHSTLLLIFVLLADGFGLANATRYYTLKRYFPDHHMRKYHDLRNRTERSSRFSKHSNSTGKTLRGIPVETAQTGTVAILHCKVKFNNVTVLWLKKEGNDSFTLLTVNASTHSWDKRFYASNEKDPKDWTLQISYPKQSDEGLYECQIFTEPKTTSLVQLQLIEARADIFGGSPKIVKAGSPLRLSCVLRRSINPPAYIFWYHEDRMINYDLTGGASVRHGRQGSELIIPRVDPSHAGNYSCVPSNARQASVIVDVKHGHSEKQAAMQSGNKNSASHGITCQPHNIVNMLLLILTFHLRR
ncbi:protein borderless [Aethina tumida]|uniref:protein borderless n=1 Tax=Aethina tumida TaxID=116153 RepID=UPI0021480ED3|nr:protein borderless [Aethina tumida]